MINLLLFSIIGHFTGKYINNFAHAQAVSSRPSLQGRPVKEASAYHTLVEMIIIISNFLISIANYISLAILMAFAQYVNTCAFHKTVAIGMLNICRDFEFAGKGKTGNMEVVSYI